MIGLFTSLPCIASEQHSNVERNETLALLRRNMKINVLKKQHSGVARGSHTPQTGPPASRVSLTVEIHMKLEALSG